MTGTLVWDSTALVHAARADRLDVLGDIAATWQNLVTSAVLTEVRRNSNLLYGHLNWLTDEPVDAEDQIQALARWAVRLSIEDGYNRGEASVFTLAETRNAIAVTDDGNATKIGRAHGLEVHGTLWVVARAVRAERYTDQSASGFVEALRAAGSRLPFAVDGFVEWATKKDLL